MFTTENQRTPSGGNDQLEMLHHNLLQSCSWLNNNMRGLLESFDITPKQYSILRILEDCKPDSLSIQGVRKRLADKMSDASRLIDRLDRKGYLYKFPSDTDRRSNRTRITEKGTKLLKQIAAQAPDMEQRVFEKLSPAEIDQLMELLHRLR